MTKSLTLPILATLLLVSSITFAAPVTRSSQGYENAKAYFNKIRTDESQLVEFFKSFPKGAELHHHFMGAPQAEEIALEGMQQGLCMDKNSYGFTPCGNNTVNISSVINNLQSDLDYRQTQTVNDLDMPVLIRHKVFFDSFGKRAPIYNGLPYRLLSKLRIHAAEDNVQYLETMTSWNEYQGLNMISNLLDGLPGLQPLTTQSMERFRQALLNKSDFQTLLLVASKEYGSALSDSDNELECSESPPQPACQVIVRFLQEINRLQSPELVFAHMVLAFELAQTSLKSLSPIVLGMNIVGAEDSNIARRDLSQHLSMFNYMKALSKYRDAAKNISLHAGELNRKIAATPEEIGHSLANTIRIAQPARVGHAVSLMNQSCDQFPDYNPDAPCGNFLMQKLVDTNTGVEILLTSNEMLLDVSGSEHPVQSYIDAGVAVVLSTDDPGQLEIDLTSQFVLLAMRYTGIDFDAIVRIARNSLSYSFLPGQSFWKPQPNGAPDYSHMVSECSDPSSSDCNQYLDDNLRAAMEFSHNQALSEFFNRFTSMKHEYMYYTNRDN